MNYVLMHKRTPVAALELDDVTCTIQRIGEVYAEAHIPVGIKVQHGMIDRSSLNAWWTGRSIPASRMGLKNALEKLEIPSAQMLLNKSFGLSLSDQYWICPEGLDLKWDDINFFENPFSEDVGNILFGQKNKSEQISFMTPDNTSDGWLKKRWKILDGKRVLLKGGSGALQQEPYNEVLASAVMRRLHIPHVDYTLLTQEEYPYSVCEDFITPDTELITAWYVMQTQKKENHVSVYQHYINCCDALGIPGIRESLDQMLVLDYLIANEDRHQNNFGVVRDVNTMQFTGAAPLYDNGSSMWFLQPTPMINGVTDRVICKPFKNSHEEQIKLVSSFDWLDLNALKGIDEECREIFKGSVFIDEKRQDALCTALLQRISRLEQVMQQGLYAVKGTENDVEKDTAYSQHEM